MRSRGAMVALAGAGLAAGLLLPWMGAVRAGDQATDYTETKLVAPDGEPEDFFGDSVAVSGDTALIGASGDEDLGYHSGSAYVFERDPLDPRVWTQIAKLTASDGGLIHQFGACVAISGDTALIGAPFHDELSDQAGAAYVFERDPLDPKVWRETAKLTASDGDLTAFDFFGSSVAISEDRAVIGAYGDDELGSTSGSAYIFERQPFNPVDWNQTAKLTASDGAQNDNFGDSVAISGDTAVIGAYGADFYFSGAAYVYSPRGCELGLALEPATLRAGEELRVAVDIDHRRPVTVTVPFLLRVEDAAGQVVVQKSSPPVTMEPGDHRQQRLAVTLPPGMLPGRYRLVVGVRHMQQGIAWAARPFRVIEHAASRELRPPSSSP